MSNNSSLKEQLKSIQNQLTQMQKQIMELKASVAKVEVAVHDSVVTMLQIRIDELKSSMQESDLPLYYSIFTSALIGVMSSIFVEFAFQPEPNMFYVAITGFSLAVMFAWLMKQMITIYRRTMKQKSKIS